MAATKKSKKKLATTVDEIRDPTYTEQAIRIIHKLTSCEEFLCRMRGRICSDSFEETSVMPFVENDSLAEVVEVLEDLTARVDEHLFAIRDAVYEGTSGTEGMHTPQRVKGTTILRCCWAAWYSLDRAQKSLRGVEEATATMGVMVKEPTPNQLPLAPSGLDATFIALSEITEDLEEGLQILDQKF